MNGYDEPPTPSQDPDDKYSLILIEDSQSRPFSSDDEQAMNERTLKDASQHLMDSLAKLDILFRASRGLQREDVLTLIIDGPILSSLHDVHDLAIKAHNTVEYLREQEA